MTQPGWLIVPLVLPVALSTGDTPSALAVGHITLHLTELSQGQPLR